jgi:galactokinase
METSTYTVLLTQQFRQRFGEDPAIIVRAPGRINLIGEHTDYNEGFVLPAAIDKAVYFALSPRTDLALHWYASDIDQTYSSSLEHLDHSDLGWPNYLLGVISELLQDGHQLQGTNVVFGGNIPAGSGLSSSAAIENGMSFALNTLFNLNIARLELVKLAQRAENNFVGMQCGIMDMFASMMGREGQALQIDCRSLDFHYYPFDAPDYRLVLCNSGVKHALVDSEYNTRRKEAEQGVSLLKEVYPTIHSLRDVTPPMLFDEQERLPELIYRRCKHVVEENQRVLQACTALENHDFVAFGDLLYQSHQGLQYEYEVSCTEMDYLVDFTRNEEAVLGARMMGGGFGGCTLNLVHHAGVDDFLQKISASYYATFGIALATHIVALTNGVETLVQEQIKKAAV